MKLKQLVKDLKGIEIRGSKEVEITGLSTDSATVAPGNLFIARRGEKFDGGQFIQQAVASGAAAIVTEIYDPFLKQTQIIYPNPGDLEAKLAARYYGRADQELFVVGVTGTKGKTTTSYLVKHMLDELKGPCGLIGTVETIVGEKRFFSSLTTHFAITNHKLLREMAANGCQSASLEVSSHGLAQNRVGEIAFDAAIFTNLYPDHLDYHSTMEEYAAVKRLLFQRAEERAIFNADSPWCSFMREGCKAAVLTFGIEKKADVQASEIAFTSTGTEFTVTFEGKSHRFFTPLMGRFNVSNCLGAIALGLHNGASLEKIAASLARFQSVPGRLEQVPDSRAPRVFVDYAHNGEALENVLKTLREIASKRIITVFGCGGNRDPGRRKGMAEAAETFSDLSIITSDNPRQEDPEEICRQIRAAYRNNEKAIVELDRKKAIQLALQIAAPDDIVLIAGKGHERVQIFAHQTIPFDDVAVAKSLQNLKNSAILGEH